jgi:hypothetical protein
LAGLDTDPKTPRKWFRRREPAQLKKQSLLPAQMPELSYAAAFIDIESHKLEIDGLI